MGPGKVTWNQSNITTIQFWSSGEKHSCTMDGSDCHHPNLMVDHNIRNGGTTKYYMSPGVTHSKSQHHLGCSLAKDIYLGSNQPVDVTSRKRRGKEEQAK